jgi:formylglycine-generating enzyme required for sulfatase activity
VPIKADLIDIPGGKFQMGRNDSSTEGPAHEVTLNGFQMDKNEVTNAEYGQFVKQTNHTPPEQWGSPKPPWAWSSAGEQRVL